MPTSIKPFGHTVYELETLLDSDGPCKDREARFRMCDFSSEPFILVWVYQTAITKSHSNSIDTQLFSNKQTCVLFK